MTNQRPGDLSVIAILSLLFGGLGFVSWLASLIGSPILGGRDAERLGSPIVYSLILLVTSALQLAFGYGAWNLKRWAWTVGVITQVLTIALAVIYVLLGYNLLAQLIGIIYPAILLYYLFTPGAKKALGKS